MGETHYSFLLEGGWRGSADGEAKQENAAMECLVG